MASQKAQSKKDTHEEKVLVKKDQSVVSKSACTKLKSPEKCQYVHWRSINTNNCDVYNCWLQYDGNETVLTELSRWMKSETGDMNDDTLLDLETKITYTEAEALENYGCDHQRGVYHSVIEGRLPVPMTCDFEEWRDRLYCDLISELFE